MYDRPTCPECFKVINGPKCRFQPGTWPGDYYHMNCAKKAFKDMQPYHTWDWSSWVVVSLIGMPRN